MGTRGIIGQVARIREQANFLIEEEIKKCGIEHMLPAHGALMGILFAQNEPVPIKFLVDRLRRAKSSVTEMLKTLQRYGYVHKVQDQADKRVMMVELTEEGRALRGDFEGISKTLLERVYGEMPERERERLMEGLIIIEKNLRGE